MSDWFNVNKEGLAKILGRRPPEFVVFELLQNALDQNVTRVDVRIEPVPGRPLVALEVEDDDPEGFADLAHAFTLFAESAKKSDPEKRGRFNLGEKLVIALCSEARIESTTGTIVFDSEGRHKRRFKREQGSKFCGLLRVKRDELERLVRAARCVIVPPQVVLAVNGQRLEQGRVLVGEVPATLDTEVASDDGTLRRTLRKTTIRVYEPAPGEPAAIYELGIPVVETGDRWHYDVQQKVPLNMDRDNVRPAYLRAVSAIMTIRSRSVKAASARLALFTAGR